MEQHSPRLRSHDKQLQTHHQADKQRDIKQHGIGNQHSRGSNRQHDETAKPSGPESTVATSETDQQQRKRGRGEDAAAAGSKPAVPPTSQSAAANQPGDVPIQPAKRPRGRPRKHPIDPVAPTATAAAGVAAAAGPATAAAQPAATTPAAEAAAAAGTGPAAALAAAAEAPQLPVWSSQPLKRRGRPPKHPMTPAAPSQRPPATPALPPPPTSPGQAQWWHPQPRPSLNEEHIEHRPSPPLAEVLRCPVCSDVLKEAMTVLECGHTMCYDCLDAGIVVGGKRNTCPVCGVLLGPNPFDHSKVKYDSILDSLIKKVFPRPLLDAALDARRAEREEGTRELKEQLKRRGSHAEALEAAMEGNVAGPTPNKRTPGRPGVTSPPPAPVAIALFPAAAAADPTCAGPQPQNCPEPATSPSTRRRGLDAVGSPAGGKAAGEKQQQQQQQPQELPPLARPYVSVPPQLTVATLRGWLIEQLVAQMASGTGHGGDGGGGGGGNDAGGGGGGEEIGSGGGRSGPGGEGGETGVEEQRTEQQQEKQKQRRKRQQKEQAEEQVEDAIQGGPAHGPGQSPQQQRQHQQQRHPQHQQVESVTAAQLRQLQLLCCGQLLTQMNEGVGRLQQRVWETGRKAAAAGRAGKRAGGSEQARGVHDQVDQVMVLSYRVSQ